MDNTCGEEPRVWAATALEDRAAAPPSLPPGLGTTGTIRVVVVDDDDTVRHMVRILLSMEDDYKVVGEASDGIEGSAIVVEAQPDVVLVDLEMPAMDGLVAISEIRERAPGTKIAVLSAFPDPYTLGDALGRGADTYLDKAMSLSELPELLRSLVAPGSGPPA